MNILKILVLLNYNTSVLTWDESQGNLSHKYNFRCIFMCKELHMDCGLDAHNKITQAEGGKRTLFVDYKMFVQS